jgi:hypothetical protein
MQKISEPSSNRRPMPEPIPCRWKHLRGRGHNAVYRATCGRDKPCPGHLGDLGYFDWLGNHATHPYSDEDEEPFQKLKDAGNHTHTAGVMGTRCPEWLMSADYLHVSRGQGRKNSNTDHHRIYRGFADSGYRVSHGGKRDRTGDRVGRRPGPELTPEEIGLRLHRYAVEGQIVRLPARIWCPVCGTLGLVELPESLRGCEAS